MVAEDTFARECKKAGDGFVALLNKLKGPPHDDLLYKQATERLRQIAENHRPPSDKALLAAVAITGLTIAGVVYAADAFAKRRGWTDRVAAEKTAKPKGQQL
jgi:hypothetical protein